MGGGGGPACPVGREGGGHRAAPAGRQLCGQSRRLRGCGRLAPGWAVRAQGAGREAATTQLRGPADAPRFLPGCPVWPARPRRSRVRLLYITRDLLPGGRLRLWLRPLRLRLLLSEAAEPGGAEWVVPQGCAVVSESAPVALYLPVVKEVLLPNVVIPAADVSALQGCWTVRGLVGGVLLVSLRNLPSWEGRAGTGPGSI